jgi:hypothetical protein
VQTRKFFIKVLVRNRSVSNVRTSDFMDLGYNLKRDGWLNSFTDLKNQSVRVDGVAWRGAREKRPDFFSILFTALTDKDDIIFDWQCGVGSFFLSKFSHFFLFGFSDFICNRFLIHFPMLIPSHFVCVGGSIIACRLIQRHIVALGSDIDVFKSILLPLREPDQEQTSQPAAPQRGFVFVLWG